MARVRGGVTMLVAEFSCRNVTSAHYTLLPMPLQGDDGDEEILSPEAAQACRGGGPHR